MTDDPYAHLKPLILFEYDDQPGKFSLLLTDTHFHTLAHHFNAIGYSGAGYDWVAVAKESIRSRAPELEGRMNFDPEAGMFCAYGTDGEALEKLGTLMKEALEDEALLVAIIGRAEAGWFD